MTRVDFYLLPASESVLPYACRLTEKAYRQGHKVFLATDTDEEAAQLDDLLWTFRQGSFVPHSAVTGHTAAGPCPVAVGRQPPAGFNDVMINLGSTVPEAFRRFRRVIELVGPDDAARALKREHFRYYRSQGLSPAMVDLEAGA
ncbi:MULTISPECIES: DNA polymerase III subunit chi [Methylococcus]|uniref:DNA polymerase III subunit chi n=1 Tax=Methylococcus capsulatus TaxID=414 RepID=A0ABZ2F6Z0_METCP|nr:MULTISPECIES: DNA polymerase III subunit chi [Methylococcus]MDF9392497.1 DNA polymerase III subunit chi [Methylococcus capsulatus]